MATAVHLPSPETAGAPLNEVPHTHSQSNSYSSKRLTLTDFDLRDDRYPSLPSAKPSVISPRSQSGGVDPALDAGMTAALRASYEKTHKPDTSTSAKSWIGENITQEPAHWDLAQDEPQSAVLEAQSQSPNARDSPRTAGNLAAGSYLLDEPATNDVTPGDPAFAASVPLPQSPDMGQRMSLVRPSGDQYDVAVHTPSHHTGSQPLPPGASPGTPLVSPGATSSPRHPSLPAAGNGASSNASPMAPIVPLSAGPTYNPSAMQIPISSNPRAYAQHPTYITPSPAPAMQPSFSPPQVPKEEVCVECAMRDQDMADVDVTSPGVWDRESDVLYEELCRREAEEEASGLESSDNHSRPRAKGGKLTEENLRFWLSIVRCTRSCPLELQTDFSYRTLRSPRPASKPLTNMSSHSGNSWRQTPWPVHRRCASLGYLTRRCATPSLNSDGQPTSSAVALVQQTIMVPCASRPHARVPFPPLLQLRATPVK